MAQRKTVTVLFSDVVGSTGLGESLDAEALRGVLGRYFDETRTVVERHGGTLEKFIGDAVVALFGVPVAREDDALRALRAAAEIRGRLDELNDELEGKHGVRLEVRTGVNTGEVVVDDSQVDGFRASGDTMNTAARLEQAASPGEILIGALTRELGGDAIVVEAVDGLELKGKAAPVQAFRLLRVLPDTSPYVRRQDAPLVGREDELAALHGALADATNRHQCSLITLVGAAGVGKSRLAREFAASLGESAQVLVGRCIPYGEGVTFLPVAEALRPFLGDDVRAGVLRLLADDESRELVAEHVASALGEGEPASTEDVFWAIRKLLETVARERPVVFVVDDVHWAEPTLLDLLEYTSSFSAEAPIVVIALTRPDLLEERPDWATPREHATIVLLEPLAEHEAAALAALLAQSELGQAEIRRLVEAADGNPLFLEQLLALNADRESELTIPPTIQALLSARIDRLGGNERLVLECASIEGREFHRDALGEMVPESVRPEIGAHLLSLARRQFIRAVTGGGPRESFAFSHGLMRDATYEAIPKERRAELHVRLADHLEREELAAGEVIGHHLAQASRYRRELGQEGMRELAGRAAELLATGAERAFSRGDDRAAARLLDEACDLISIEEATGRRLRIELGRALAGAGMLERSRSVFLALRAAASEAGDPGLERRADLGLMSLRAQTDAHLPMPELIAVAEDALPLFGEQDDERGLARAWFLIHWAKFRLGRCEESIGAAEQVVEHSARAGDAREQLRALGAIAMATFYGPTPVSEGLARCEELVQRAGGARLVEAFTLRVSGGLLSMTGDFDDARKRCARAADIYEELGHPISAIGVVMELQRVEVQAGRLDSAERELRAAYDRLRGLADIGYVSWVAAALARVLALRGESAEALELARVAREELQRDLAYGQIVARLAEVHVLAHDGRVPQADARALEALEVAGQTDLVWLQADCLAAAAEVDRVAGREEEARQRIEEALESYGRKGDAVSAARLRGLSST